MMGNHYRPDHGRDNNLVVGKFSESGRFGPETYRDRNDPQVFFIALVMQNLYALI